jgi:hypothetical protein
MTRPALCLLATLSITTFLAHHAPEATAQNAECEDQLGNIWTLPLDQYQAGMRPQGPCLPVGTWRAMQRAADRPRTQQRRVGPEECARQIRAWQDRGEQGEPPACATIDARDIP